MKQIREAKRKPEAPAHCPAPEAVVALQPCLTSSGRNFPADTDPWLEF